MEKNRTIRTAAISGWNWLYEANFGLFNYIFSLLWIHKLKFIASSELVVPSLALIAVWLSGNLIVMFPIWWIFRSSLMTNAELFQWPPTFLPPNWLFSNYKEALVYFPFWEYFKNTMTIIIPSVIGGTFTATLGGYAFARLRFPGKKFLFSLCVGSMLLPTPLRE